MCEGEKSGLDGTSATEADVVDLELTAVDSEAEWAEEPAPSTHKKSLFASAFPPGTPLPEEFVEGVRGLAAEIDMPVWFLVQNGHEHRGAWSLLSDPVYGGFMADRRTLRAAGRVALVVDSPGGYAQAAYQIARLLQRHCGGFTAIVPRYAKSAATLLCLGADQIIMGEDAELGPLDAQLWDNEREEHGSALDEVQALEQLYAVALEQVDQMMTLLQIRTPKRTETLLPIACRFSADMMAPLLDKVDAVHYAKQSRILKVAEDYAFKLLSRRHTFADAKRIANHLVRGYPEHGFVIDRDDARDELGLNVVDADEPVAAAVQRLDDLLESTEITAHGRLVEKAAHHEDSGDEEHL